MRGRRSRISADDDRLERVADEHAEHDRDEHFGRPVQSSDIAAAAATIDERDAAHFDIDRRRRFRLGFTRRESAATESVSARPTHGRVDVRGRDRL